MMLEWVWHTAEQVAQEAEADQDYRELARRRKALEAEYEDLVGRLSPVDRELLLEYMDVEANLQYRMTQLAYRFGKRIGQRERRWGLGKTDKK